MFIYNYLFSEPLDIYKNENDLVIPKTLEQKLLVVARKNIDNYSCDMGAEFKSIQGSKVFIDPTNPGYIIKMAKTDGYKYLDSDKGKWITNLEMMERRFRNIIVAKTVCEEKQLNLLVVPKTAKLTVERDDRKYIFVIEEWLNFTPSSDSGQAELYSKLTKELDRTVQQLAIFIAETGFLDVTHRNIPLINEDLGERQVALIDLEHMDLQDRDVGFKGHRGTLTCPGLINCLFFEQHLDAVIEVAKRYQIELDKTARLEGIKKYRELEEYYADKGIKTGHEPIEVDVASLEIEEGMRPMAVAMIQEINTLLQKANKQEGVMGKRRIKLRFFGALEQYKYHPYINNESLWDKKIESFWSMKIIRALTKQEVVKELLNRDDNSFSLQV